MAHDILAALSTKAQAIRADRARRHDLFGKQAMLFYDPAWDILLTLAASNDAVPAPQLTEESLVPTSLPRWLRVLESENLIDTDGGDVALSERGAAMMSAYLLAA